jgi:hypothetical protein
VERSVALVPSAHFALLPVRLDYSALETRHPYQVGIPQAEVETFLEKDLATYDAPVL